MQRIALAAMRRLRIEAHKTPHWPENVQQQFLNADAVNCCGVWGDWRAPAGGGVF